MDIWNEQPLVLAFASDDGYAPYLMLALASALRHLPAERPCDVYIMDQGISAYRKARLQSVAASHKACRLHYLNVRELDSKLDALFAARGKKGKLTKWSYTTYYRLFLAELLPKVSRILYLDVDILVCDDLGKIFDIDMQGKAVAGVADVCLCHDSGSSEYRESMSAGGLDMQRYFNAGILLLNLDKWRRYPDFGEMLKEAFCRLPNLIYPDQEILNDLFREDKLMLPLRWNYLVPQTNAQGMPDGVETESKRIATEKDFGIIHFAGKKPWRKPVDLAFADLWWAEARRSGLEGDILQQEILLLRRYLEAQREAKRCLSLKFQLLLLKLQLFFRSGKSRQRLEGKLSRVGAKLQHALACRKIRF